MIRYVIALFAALVFAPISDAACGGSGRARVGRIGHRTVATRTTVRVVVAAPAIAPMATPLPSPFRVRTGGCANGGCANSR